MKILVLNCGSTSIKFKLFDKDTLNELCEGVLDKIGTKDSVIKVSTHAGYKIKVESEIKDYRIGIQQILEILLSKEANVLKSTDELAAVGHRVAAGTSDLRESIIVDEAAKAGIEEAILLAPLHNRANLAGVLAIEANLGKIKQVVVFDTSFHQTIPKHAYVYPLPYELYEEEDYRKIGFHGTSHRYVSERACEFLNVDYKKQRIIVAHLGGGASINAICDGKSLDVSLGMTSLSGIMMGTRCGDIDPGVLTLLQKRKNLSVVDIEDIIFNKSGLLGISGVSSDMRAIEEAALAGNERAQLAMDVFVYQIKKQVGAFTALLGGLDILVFTGGIGENHAYTREKVCEGMQYLGMELDVEKNKTIFGKESIISKSTSKVKVLVIPTNEELMIAKDTKKLIENS